MTKQDKPPLTRRIIFPIQSRGGIGKSTFLGGLISYLKFAEVEFDACDSDTVHHTLTDRNQDVITQSPFDATASFDAFHTLLANLSDAPVTLIDFPAQKTEDILKSFAHFDVLDGFDQDGIRATVTIFADDDEKSKVSASQAVGYFKDRVDYILVENPACFTSKQFKTIPLYRTLIGWDTPTVRLDTIDDTSMRSWEALERTCKPRRRWPLDEACTTRELYWTTRHALNGFRNSLLVQFEDIAVPRIVPDADLIQNRVERVEALAAVPVSALDDPML